MAVLIGNDNKPNGSFYEGWSDTYNQSAELFTMPDRGRIVQVGFWAAGINQTTTTYGCVWLGSTGALVAQSASITIAGRSFGAGNVDKYVVDLVTPYELDAGVTFYAGLSRAPGRSHQLSGGDIGSGQHWDNRKSTWPNAIVPNDTGGHGHGNYRVGCHVFYEPIAGAWIRRSGAWVRATDTQVRRAGAWVDVDDVQVRRSGVWNDAD